MLTNGKITIYHKGYDEEKRVETWTYKSYESWFHGGKGSSINKGYENANDCDVRIPYDKNSNLDIKDFSIGDIIVVGEVDIDIESSKKLLELGYEVYNITSKVNNTFGNNKHVHIGGK